VTAYPDSYLYSKEHEWARPEEGEVVLGVTAYAQEELGDVVFVELPQVGEVFAANDEVGTIESVKAVAELYTPVGGEVVAVNPRIEDEPELVNSDPHGEGWLVRLRLADASELEGLMDAAAYVAFLGEDG